jgi:DNA-binding transcriptional ArsR family regulator
MYFHRCPLLSTTIAQARLERLVSLGLVDSNYTSTNRIIQLKSRLNDDSGDLRKTKVFFSSLGDETRLRILKVIGNEELCSCEVMAALGLTQPTTSHHLGILERAGILTSRRRGKWVFYRISTRKISTLLSKAVGLLEDVT